MRILPLGVGDAFSAKHYSSSIAVESGGQWLLVDCPHPVRKMVREAAATAGIALDVAQFLAVALTHLHGDHVSGLETLAFYYRYALRKKLALCTHPAVAADLWCKHLAGSMEYSLPAVGAAPVQRVFEDFFGLYQIDENQTAAIGPFTLSCKRTLHSVPTVAYRVQAGGRTLGLSADTPFDPELIAWLGDADLIVHEAGGAYPHTEYDKLLQLSDDLKKKMRLIHCPDAFDANASSIELLNQGCLYQV
ncbi:MAG: MBL fold metallo-hydrolase [Gemmataceae bacterium]|nr:MBL fold metallo-hydrolase [Gemmataceae bacterium]MCI0738278.1 MBL fold metallo-hydrolase [Gemmataceae bacterium]